MQLSPEYEAKMQALGFIPANHREQNFFEVDCGGIYDREGTVIPGWQRVFREDTNATLGIHSERYKMRPYKETFALFDRAIEESGLDLTGMRIATDLTHDGGRCFRQYLLPAHVIGTRGEPDVALRIIGIDSYDGSYAANLMAGAYQFVCANTSVIGKHIIQLRVRHVGNAAERFIDGVERVIEAAQAFVEMGPRIQHWPEVELTTEIFAEMLTRSPAFTKAQAEHLVTNYATTTKERNLYNAWTLLTSWSSHGEWGRGKPGNLLQARTSREQQVAKLVESPMWKALERA